MSIPVELEALRDETARRANVPYLLTSSEDGRPHAVAVTLRWEDASLVGGCGRTSGRNATAHPAVSLLWPPDEPGGYSLIVDAAGEVRGEDEARRIVLTPEKAVLHRPAEDPAPGTACEHDCVPVLHRRTPETPG